MSFTGHPKDVAKWRARNANPVSTWDMAKSFATPIGYKRSSWVDDHTWQTANAVALERALDRYGRCAFFLRLGLIETNSSTAAKRKLDSWQPKRMRARTLQLSSVHA